MGWGSPIEGEGFVMSTAGMVGRPVRVAWFHVVGVVGHHPRNKWVRLPSGLYDLSGSAYAFSDDQVQACPEPGGGRCGCELPELVSRYGV